jgi:hypothetical protein
MPGTTVTEVQCDLCGAEIREGSQFCYNCGHAVPAAASQEAEVPPPVVAEPPVRNNTRPPLRSAASLRKQRRAYNRQPVEVTWEPKTGTPVGFVVASLVLVFGALVLLLIALYLR